MSGKMILLLTIIICILLFNYLCKFIIWISDLVKTTPKITIDNKFVLKKNERWIGIYNMDDITCIEVW